MARRRRKHHAAARSTRGWHSVAPKTREERRSLYDRCGAKAFLMPNKSNHGKSKFPIMPKHGACSVDCRGLRAALTRAGQFKHPKAHAKAKRLAKTAKCHWAA